MQYRLCCSGFPAVNLTTHAPRLNYYCIKIVKNKLIYHYNLLLNILKPYQYLFIFFFFKIFFWAFVPLYTG